MRKVDTPSGSYTVGAPEQSDKERAETAVLAALDGCTPAETRMIAGIIPVMLRRVRQGIAEGDRELIACMEEVGQDR